MRRRPSIVNRGCYADGHLQDRYESALRDLIPAGMPADLRTIRAYYLYLCKRRLRMVFLAGAYGSDGIANYVGYAARTLFDLMSDGRLPSGNRGQRPAVRSWERRVSMDAETSGGRSLGRSGMGRLGEETVLGTSAVSNVGELGVEVIIRLVEWNGFVSHGGALIMFLQACDLAVPISMNFRIHFRGDPSEATARLPAMEDGGAAGEYPMVLGINSELGRE